MLLNLLGEFWTTRLDDTAFIEHMDKLRLDHLQQTVVVGDDDTGCLRRLEFVHTLCHDTHRIDIKARVGLVEDAQLRLEHCHLEDLITLLLTTAEALVHGTVSQLGVEFHDLALLALQLQKLSGIHRLQALILALLVDGSLHEVGHRHTRNLHRILEREEQPLVGSVLWLHLQQVLAIKECLTLSDLVERVTHQHGTERTLT